MWGSFSCNLLTLRALSWPLSILLMRGGLFTLALLAVHSVGVSATLTSFAACLAIADAISSASDVYWPGTSFVLAVHLAFEGGFARISTLSEGHQSLGIVQF